MGKAELLGKSYTRDNHASRKLPILPSVFMVVAIRKGILTLFNASPGMICFGMLRGLPIRANTGQQLCQLGMRTQARLEGQWVWTLSEPPVNVGYLDERVGLILQGLTEEMDTALQAQITRVQQRPSKQSEGKTRAAQRQLELSVIVYGTEAVLDLVGDFLTKFDLYLQDPVGSNYYVRYRNPQSLWALDESIVRMTDDLSSEEEVSFESFQNPVDLLAELEYEGDLPEAGQPAALRTPLYS